VRRHPERKSTREVLNDLEELAVEELGRVLSYYAKNTNKPKLLCCC
jgi:hypothetical protein